MGTSENPFRATSGGPAREGGRAWYGALLTVKGVP
jgi:hypothetical protein